MSEGLAGELFEGVETAKGALESPITPRTVAVHGTGNIDSTKPIEEMPTTRRRDAAGSSKASQNQVTRIVRFLEGDVPGAGRVRLIAESHSLDDAKIPRIRTNVIPGRIDQE